jgi:hypothetical protein
MNREQRRHPERQQTEHGDPTKKPEDELREQSRQQDELSVRAKNSGHKKKTADKWNQ